MKRILLTTLGTRGDVQPYIGLSQKLIKEGYSITLASSNQYSYLADRYNIPYSPIGEKGNSSNHYIESLLEENRVSSIGKGLDLLFQGMKNSHDEIMELCKSHDIIIGHGFIGETEAELNNIPFIRVSISPDLAKKELWKSKKISDNLKIILERFIINGFIIKRYNKFRNEIEVDNIDIDEYNKKPILLPISKYLVDRKESWSPNNYLTGYWYTEEPQDFAPPENLVKFINNNDKIAVMTFGSMSWGEKDIQSIINLIQEVSSSADISLVVIGWDNKMSGYLNTDRIYYTKSIPYSWLFKHAFCVIHHCGLGTVNEVLRSCLPSIPVPHLIDQFFRSSCFLK